MLDRPSLKHSTLNQSVEYQKQLPDFTQLDQEIVGANDKVLSAQKNLYNKKTQLLNCYWFTSLPQSQK